MAYPSGYATYSNSVIEKQDAKIAYSSIKSYIVPN